MKKQSPQSLHPTKLATATTIITSTTAFLTTILSIINPALTTITPIFKTLYEPLGYSISLTGSLLGTLYIAIDSFILTYLFAWIYNKLL